MAPNPVNRSDMVPGTVHLVDVAGTTASSKRSKAHKDIVLIPSPSADPEDPLNWSRARKYRQLLMLAVYTLGIGVPTTLQYSVLADITEDTGITTAQLVNGTGFMFLFLGWGCLLWQPVAITYGRRGVYILSCVACCPIMVWTAYSHSYGEWYAHRILLGLVCSPIESLPEVSIPDFFFAHERGTWVGAYVLFLFGSNFLAPLVAGWFNDAYGWRWVMYFGAIIAAAAAVLLFFFMEETLYFRSTIEGDEEDVGTQPPAPPSADEKADDSADKKAIASPTPTPTGSRQPLQPFPPPRTYLQKLNLFVRLPGRPRVKHMFAMMYRPLLILLQFPNITWAGFLYGLNLCWYLILNGTASPILSAAPYNWDAALVGSSYTGAILGAIGGAIWSGTISDRWAIFLARRNNGVREPEQRLWPLLVSAIICAAGLILWGVGAAYEVHWVGLEFGMGMLAFGCITGGSIAISYCVDCFKEISGESMVSVILVRNTMGFGISYAITPWVERVGLRDCFITVAMLSLVCTGTFLGMVVVGKRLRRFSTERYWRYVRTTVAGGL